MGQGAVVVGAAAAEAHEDHSLHGPVERQAACHHGPGSNTSWPVGKSGELHDYRVQLTEHYCVVPLMPAFCC